MRVSAAAEMLPFNAAVLMAMEASGIPCQRRFTQPIQCGERRGKRWRFVGGETWGYKKGIIRGLDQHPILGIPAIFFFGSETCGFTPLLWPWRSAFCKIGVKPSGWNGAMGRLLVAEAVDAVVSHTQVLDS